MPKQPPDHNAAQSHTFLAGGGEMGERTRSFDWSKTALGPVGTWPQSLKTLVRTLLNTRYAMWLGWGRTSPSSTTTPTPA
ncbi:MAG TPA: hypothetical protein VH092_22960 [Urbifossiella sp.]|nr:hypothetical protein [Urbifossiella sp.]